MRNRTPSLRGPSNGSALARTIFTLLPNLLDPDNFPNNQAHALLSLFPSSHFPLWGLVRALCPPFNGRRRAPYRPHRRRGEKRKGDNPPRPYTTPKAIKKKNHHHHHHHQTLPLFFFFYFSSFFFWVCGGQPRPFPPFLVLRWGPVI